MNIINSDHFFKVTLRAVASLSPGWARVPLPHFSSNQDQLFFLFFLKLCSFSIFLPHFGPPGGRVREGPGYATGHTQI